MVMPTLGLSPEWQKTNHLTSLEGRLLGKGVWAWLTGSSAALLHFQNPPQS